MSRRRQETYVNEAETRCRRNPGPGGDAVPGDELERAVGAR